MRKCGRIRRPTPTSGTGALSPVAGSCVILLACSDDVTVTGIGYTISDGNGGTDTANVTITVAPVNDPPVAVDDEYVVNQGDMPGPGAETGGFVIDSVRKQRKAKENNEKCL